MLARVAARARDALLVWFFFVVVVGCVGLREVPVEAAKHTNDERKDACAQDTLARTKAHKHTCLL
jgi:hypothetical protein